KDVLANPVPVLRNTRHDQLIRRAGVRGTLQHDKLAGAAVLGDLICRRDDVAHVRVFGLAERCRHADADRVYIAQHAVIRRRGEQPRLDRAGDVVRRDVGDVALPAVDQLSLLLTDIHADTAVALTCKLDRQRQAAIPDADDGDHGFAVLYLLEQFGFI